MPAAPPLPFSDSRRLTGPNLYFAEPGAVLETVGDGAGEPQRFAAWRDYVARGRAALGWPDGPLVVRRHHGGAALAFAAPVDQLLTATELNEAAWQSATGCPVLRAPGHPAGWDEDSAQHTLQRHAAMERRPALRALLAAAQTRGKPVLLDDEQLTLGLGRFSRSWPLAALPDGAALPWDALAAIPVALVTGSNGKTTTVRLLAALLRAQGRRVSHCCTDGVFIDDEQLESGDWSGPAGARAALRHPQAEAAVLETARGGILRRGLALAHADAAIVTNISADHFGEYGIDDLAGLAEAKLVLARALAPQVPLVLNADDAELCAIAATLERPLAWFALDDTHPRLLAHRQRGGGTCAVADGHLWLSHGSRRSDLGAIADMPLAAGGSARYNLANLAGAALLGDVLGIAHVTIRTVFARFGAQRSDNPGRLERWRFAGLDILLDYAHNPEGLRGLLDVANAARGQGRLGLVLGQAGNRFDAEILALADAAAAARPDFVVLKDLDGYLRGRQPGEVPQLLHDQLQHHGVPTAAMTRCLREADAARLLLGWAQPGDVLVLPVHALSARRHVVALLDALQNSGWRCAQPLPGDPPSG